MFNEKGKVWQQTCGTVAFRKDLMALAERRKRGKGRRRLTVWRKRSL